MDELREWAKVRKVTIGGETKTLEDLLDWSQDPVEQLQGMSRKMQDECLAAADEDIRQELLNNWRQDVSYSSNFMGRVSDMEAIEKEIRFVRFIQEERKMDLFLRNQIVILPEERISLTVMNPRWEEAVAEIEAEWEEHASSDIGKKLLADIDAIMTGEE